MFDVQPSSFVPKPKIESTLLIFKKSYVHPLKNPKNLEKITRLLFNQRRKKIRKAINQLLKTKQIL